MDRIHDLIEEITGITTDLRTKREAVQRLLDPDARRRELAEAMKPYESPNGQWRFAPPEVKERAAKQKQAEQDRQVQLALYPHGLAHRKHVPQVARIMHACKEPPTLEEAWTRATGQPLNVQTSLLHSINAELVTTRVARELRDKLPSEWDPWYSAALSDPTPNQESACVIRLVEGALHGNEWQGRAFTPGDGHSRETQALQALRRKVTAAREARVPPEAHAMADELRKSQDLERVCKERYGLTPLNPSLQGPGDPTGEMPAA